MSLRLVCVALVLLPRGASADAEAVRAAREPVVTALRPAFLVPFGKLTSDVDVADLLGPGGGVQVELGYRWTPTYALIAEVEAAFLSRGSGAQNVGVFSRSIAVEASVAGTWPAWQGVSLVGYGGLGYRNISSKFENSVSIAGESVTLTHSATFGGLETRFGVGLLVPTGGSTHVELLFQTAVGSVIAIDGAPAATRRPEEGAVYAFSGAALGARFQ